MTETATAANPVTDRVIAAGALLWRQGGPAAATFGTVAAASGIAKSLVSHHFATRDALLEEIGRTLAADVRLTLDRLAARLAAAPPELVPPTEIAAVIVEQLIAGPEQPGHVLLEFASLGMASATYRTMFRNLVTAAASLVPGADEKQISAFLVGEMLSHCPQNAGPVGLIGLRQRTGWFVGGGTRPERAILSALFSLGGSRRGPARPPAPERPARATDPVDKRTAIIAATLDILAEGDAASVTHRKIAQKAGLPLASTTYHFASKQDILEAAYQHIIDEALAEVRRVTRQDGRKDEASFQRLIGEMFDFYLSEGRHGMMAHFHLALSACRTRGLSNFASRAFDAETELMRANAREHGVTLTRNLAQAITSLISGTLLLKLTDTP